MGRDGMGLDGKGCDEMIWDRMVVEWAHWCCIVFEIKSGKAALYSSLPCTFGVSVRGCGRVRLPLVLTLTRTLNLSSSQPV